MGINVIVKAIIYPTLKQNPFNEARILKTRILSIAGINPEELTHNSNPAQGRILSAYWINL